MDKLYNTVQAFLIISHVKDFNISMKMIYSLIPIFSIMGHSADNRKDKEPKSLLTPQGPTYAKTAFSIFSLI